MLAAKMAACAALLLATTGTGLCDDGKRHGFVSSVGAGLAPVAQFSEDSGRENALGIGLNFDFAYVWDHHNAIMAYASYVYRRSERYSKKAETSTDLAGNPLGDQWITFEFLGIGWRHYFGRVGHAVVTSAGIGRYRFRISDFGKNDPGVGWMLGVGYDVTPHIQTGAQFIAGESTNGSIRFSQHQLIVMLGYSTSF